MRIWFDTEFVENGRTIDLISIGAVREDGGIFYLENAECDFDAASDWVKENVLPHLLCGARLLPKAEIAQQFRAFAGDEPEFWAYYGAYDWVALCQLFGTMMDLPKGWPMYARDLKQAIDLAGVGKPPTQTDNEHHALADARWTRDAWLWLRDNGGAHLLMPSALHVLAGRV